MMKLEYDAEAKAVYISLTDKATYFGIVDRTQELTDDVLIDWMKDGTLFGIDISNVEGEPLIKLT